MNKNIILIGLFLTSQSFSYEKIYKWTDENGLIHYSSKKPENNTSTLVKIKHSRPAVSVSIEPQNDGERNEKIQNYYDQKDERKQEILKRKKQCKYSKVDLADLQSLGKCGWINRETGETYTHISNEKRAEITASLQKKIGKYCK